jgi:hypothetical protein
MRTTTVKIQDTGICTKEYTAVTVAKREIYRVVRTTTVKMKYKGSCTKRHKSAQTKEVTQEASNYSTNKNRENVASQI